MLEDNANRIPPRGGWQGNNHLGTSVAVAGGGGGCRSQRCRAHSGWGPTHSPTGCQQISGRVRPSLAHPSAIHPFIRQVPTELLWSKGDPRDTRTQALPVLDGALSLQFLSAYFKGYLGDIWGHLNRSCALENVSIHISGVAMVLGNFSKRNIHMCMHVYSVCVHIFLHTHTHKYTHTHNVNVAPCRQ